MKLFGVTVLTIILFLITIYQFFIGNSFFDVIHPAWIYFIGFILSFCTMIKFIYINKTSKVK